MEQRRISKRNIQYIEIYTFHTHIKRKGISLLDNNCFYYIYYLLHGNFIYNYDNSNN